MSTMKMMRYGLIYPIDYTSFLYWEVIILILACILDSPLLRYIS